MQVGNSALIALAVLFSGFAGPHGSLRAQDELVVEILSARTVIVNGRSTLEVSTFWRFDLEGDNGDEVDYTRAVDGATIEIEREVVVGSTEGGGNITEWIPVAQTPLDDVNIGYCPRSDYGFAETGKEVSFFANFFTITNLNNFFRRHQNLINIIL